MPFRPDDVRTCTRVTRAHNPARSARIETAVGNLRYVIDADVPIISASLLRDAEHGCGLRVAQRWARKPALRLPFGPARIRTALIDQLRALHRVHARIDATMLTASDELSPEEQAVFSRAAEGYCQLFIDSPATADSTPADGPTLLPRRGIAIAAPIDLVLTTHSDGRELRLLRYGADALLADLDTDPRVRLAILRMSVLEGTETPLLVSVADVLNGDLRQMTCTPADVLAEYGAWLDAGVEMITGRNAQPHRGTECTRCQFVHTCPAIPQRAGGMLRRHDYLPPIAAFTPTSYDTWSRCAYQYKLGRLLGLPPSDISGAPDEGIMVHRLLETLHRRGDCHDDAIVDAVLDEWNLGDDQRSRGFIDRHRLRCPSPVEALGHEYEEARFHRHPLPNFISAARFDAIWIHDGVLDVRDYKTGGRSPYRVADDPRARIQAWVLAPLAESLGLQLSIRFEMLAPELEEDPEPFTPDVDDVDAITEELRSAAEALLADDTPPSPDPRTCGFCAYRSICAHSAAPSIARWPIVGTTDIPTTASDSHNVLP